MNFTHLHVHSHYSVLDGMSKIPDLIAKCQRTGMTAMALTDHGCMYGIKEFLDTAKKINGKPKGKVKDCQEAIKKAEENCILLNILKSSRALRISSEAQLLKMS